MRDSLRSGAAIHQASRCPGWIERLPVLREVGSHSYLGRRTIATGPEIDRDHCGRHGRPATARRSSSARSSTSDDHGSSPWSGVNLSF